MVEENGIKQSAKFRLLPFQEELINNFLKEESDRIVEFSLPAGSGKSHLAVEIVKRMAPQITSVLLLAPRSLLDQYRYIFKETSASLEPIIVDRRRLLDFEAATDDEANIWPSNSIILMSMDLAKRKDVRTSLTENKWDLVVFDEGHMLSGQRYELYQHLSQSDISKRVLLLSPNPMSSGIANIGLVEVKLEDVINWSGEHLHPVQSREIESLAYNSTPEETKVREETKSFIDSLTAIDVAGAILPKAISRVALSSNYALEGSLRGVLRRLQELRNLYAHYPESEADVSSYIEKQLQDKEGGEDIVFPKSIEERGLLLKGLNVLLVDINRLIDLLEEIETDSKLGRLVGYLSDTLEEKEIMHTSVWTSYLSTAEYLWTALDDVFPMVYLITGAMPVEDRLQVVKEFEEKGGILISTDVSSQGLELSFVDENINYDMPGNEMKMEIRWGRFDRFGRQKPFKMLTLRDDNNFIHGT